MKFAPLAAISALVLGFGLFGQPAQASFAPRLCDSVVDSVSPGAVPPPIREGRPVSKFSSIDLSSLGFTQSGDGSWECWSASTFVRNQRFTSMRASVKGDILVAASFLENRTMTEERAETTVQFFTQMVMRYSTVPSNRADEIERYFRKVTSAIADGELRPSSQFYQVDVPSGVMFGYTQNSYGQTSLILNIPF